MEEDLDIVMTPSSTSESEEEEPAVAVAENGNLCAVGVDSAAGETDSAADGGHKLEAWRVAVGSGMNDIRAANGDGAVGDDEVGAVTPSSPSTAINSVASSVEDDSSERRRPRDSAMAACGGQEAAAAGRTNESDLKGSIAQTNLGQWPNALSSTYRGDAGGRGKGESCSARNSTESDELYMKLGPPVLDEPDVLFGAQHTMGCARGEICLGEDEVLRVEQYLEMYGFSNLWRFVAAEEFCQTDKKRAGKGRVLARGSRRSVGKVGGSGPKPKCSTSVARASLPPTAGRTAAVAAAVAAAATVSCAPAISGGEATVSRPKVEMPKVKTNPAAVKRLKDWGKRFHQIVSALCQLEICRAFIDEVTPHDPVAYNAYIDSIYPSQPIALRSILSKLEQDAYAKPLEVFNDVYCVWLAAYRAYEPGSQMWMTAHQASAAFCSQVANHPLRDDFIPTGAPVGGPSAVSGSSGVGGKNSVSPQKSHSVEQILKQIVGTASPAPRAPGHRRSAPPGVSGSGWGGRQSLGGGPKGTEPSALSRTRRQPKSKAQPAANRPFTSVERIEFQQLLCRLQQDQHLQLYHEFSEIARWREVAGGEIELDDATTPASVFRKMIVWCKKKIEFNTGGGGSLANRKRQTGSPPYPMGQPPKKRGAARPRGSQPPGSATGISALQQQSISSAAMSQTPPTPQGAGNVGAATSDLTSYRGGMATSSSSSSLSSSTESSDDSSSDSGDESMPPLLQGAGGTRPSGGAAEFGGLAPPVQQPPLPS